MWKPFAIAGALVCLAGFASPAAAQCVSVPDGLGNAAVHCSDGRVGMLHNEGGGGVSGMLGGQAIAGAQLDVVPPSLAYPQAPAGYLNPDVAIRTAPVPPPTLIAPAPQPPPESRPFSTYPDPAAAGMRLQPGEQ